MKAFLNLLAVILLFVVIWALYLSFQNEKKEKAKLEKEKLLKERKRLLQECKEKERLRDRLNRKFRWWLYPGYVIMLISFAGVSAALSLFFAAGLYFEDMLKGAAIAEVIIMVIALFILQKPIEFKYLLNQFAPYIKKKVFGKHIHIDSEIQIKHSRIQEIDEIVKLMDKSPY